MNFFTVSKESINFNTLTIMANLELLITGTVTKKSEKVNSGQNYESQLLVITTEENYPQDYPVEMQKNTLQYVDDINEGDKVEVNVSVRGKKWTNPQGEDKFFVTLAGFRISKK